MKNPTRLCGNNEKAMFTVTFCCNAAGSFLPPFVVYKSQVCGICGLKMAKKIASTQVHHQAGRNLKHS
jgi:hypothetical protein